MRTYDAMNPLAVAVQLLLTACITVFCMDPVLLGLSLCAAMALFFMRNGTGHRGFHALALGLPLLARLPLDPALANACDRGMIELFNENWLDAIVDQVIK